MTFQLGVYGKIKIYVGNSTDTKPISAGIKSGYMFIERDTGSVYVFNGSEWENASTASNVKSVSANYSATSSDSIILGTGGTGGITITLPPASQSKGKVLSFKKIDAGLGAVTIDGYGTETIDGAATYALSSQNASVTLVCDGTAWFIID